MPPTRPCLATVVVAFLAAAPAMAAEERAAPPPRSRPTTLRIQDLAFDPLKEPPKPGRAELQAALRGRYSVVQYTEGSGQKVADAIRAAKGRIIGPVVHDALLVGGVPLARLKALPGVRFAGPFLPSYKLSPKLRASFKPKEPLDLSVVVFGHADQTAKAIAAMGGKARKVRVGPGKKETALVVTIPANRLPNLAALPHVRHVEPAMRPAPRLDVAPGRVGVRANAAPPWANYQGLDGTGQVLGVYDSGGDTGDVNTLIADLHGRLQGDIANWTNPDLNPGWQDRVYDGTPYFHGTAVLDIAIGNGAGSANGLLTGVAPAATALIRPLVADAQGDTPGYLDLTTALENAYAFGARVHNDSWDPAQGQWPNLQPINDVYSVQGSAALDLFVQTNPDMLIVTAAGNDGPNASTLGTLSCSKSSLVVANSGNGDPPTGEVQALPDGGVPTYDYQGVPPDEIADHSSRGPTPAGQLKPDVSAPGTMVAAACSQATIANGTCPDDDSPPYLNQPGFAYQVGTSFAAPMVSGTALLVRQFFANEGFTPSGMLVKAVLVNGAGSISPTDDAPDEVQGWGLINLQRSLAGTGAGNLAWYDSWHAPGAKFAFLYSGQSVDFDGVEFTQGQPVAITLTWYDHVDAAFSGALVNDLDLTLASGGTTYSGGVPSMQNGVTVPNGPPDTTNTTEKIYLAAAPAGAWTLTVTAVAMAPASPQYFAVAVMSLAGQGGVTDLSKVRRLVPRPRSQ